MKNFIAIVFLSVCLIPISAFSRVNPATDLTYLGAFRVPHTSVYGYMSNESKGGGLSYRPNGNSGAGSLFVSNGSSTDGYVGEITIPTSPSTSSTIGDLPYATEIQSTTAATGGLIAADADIDVFGGVAYLPAQGTHSAEKLYWAGFEYYNVDSSDYDSLGSLSVNLSSPSPDGIWHVGAKDGYHHGNRSGDVIFRVDKDWADTYANGRYIAVGRQREGGTYNSSAGPVMFLVAPWDETGLSDGDILPASDALYYPTSNASHEGGYGWQEITYNGDTDHTNFQGADRWHDATWINNNGDHTVIFAGRRGTYDHTSPPVDCTGCSDDPTGYGPHCYGYGLTEIEGHDYCPSPIATTSYKGVHSGPYKSVLIFYDPADMVGNVSGTTDPWETDPYGMYELAGDWQFGDGQSYVGGVAYDSDEQKLYVAQACSDSPGCYPLIHVYAVQASGQAQRTPRIGSSFSGQVR